jgi:hypothetical protein
MAFAFSPHVLSFVCGVHVVANGFPLTSNSMAVNVNEPEEPLYVG